MSTCPLLPRLFRRDFIYVDLQEVKMNSGIRDSSPFRFQQALPDKLGYRTTSLLLPRLLQSPTLLSNIENVLC